jgi:stearoyl-CoA desaturase (delta-9 desaturase)
VSAESPNSVLARLRRTLSAWFDNSETAVDSSDPMAIDLARIIPFIAIHAGCIGVFWVGYSAIAGYCALVLYLLRMFAITGFYHRYFSHRSFRTSRAAQFVFAFLGALAVQRGPLWWAAHHRHHHAHSDLIDDAHSPKQHGFLWSHMGWFLARSNFATKTQKVRDLAQFAELRWLDRYDVAAPLVLALGLYGLGAFLNHSAPGLHTSGAQLLVWGFCISTVVCYHATYTINSLAHQIGRRRYRTPDDSRNNWLLALITLGEGWHNNHHHYPNSARQGFYWWEIDLTYYLLRALSWLGIVWDLKPVPAGVRDSRRLISET